MRIELVEPTDADLVPDGSEVKAVLGVQVESAESAEWHRGNAMVDEWGRQSFPASDPPSNW